MKRIEIRSFVLGANHGQYLQAAGLSHELRNLFPDDAVVHAFYHNHFITELKVHVRNLLLPKFIFMQLYWLLSMKFSRVSNSSDVTVFGSDQIWSFSNPMFPPDEFFFGTNVKSNKLAYAPSMGAVSNNFVYPPKFASLLNSFASISVRDVSTSNALQNSGLDMPKLVVDPAFFLQKKINIIPLNKRLNICRIYCPRASNTKKAINKVTNKRGCKTETIGYLPVRESWKINKQIRTPIQILNDISRSKLLITSTFHGVVMALITRTPFIAIKSDSLMARLENEVMSTFNMKRLITNEEINQISDEDLNRFMNFDDLDLIRLEQLIAESSAWLQKNVSKALAMKP